MRRKERIEKGKATKAPHTRRRAQETAGCPV